MYTTTHPVSSIEALRRLEEGNARWISGVRSVASLGSAAQRVSLAQGQSPFAVVLSCSDSRAPSEMIFDQGLGDLFVVRVAGNVVAPSLVGSIEYAVQTFGTNLVVVMGHTACGAVIATLDAIEHGRAGGTPPSPNGASENVLDIVTRIRPAVEPLTSSCDDRKELVGLATRANVRASTAQLRASSRVLADRIDAGKLMIVGAEYSLGSGEVDFFEVPALADEPLARSGRAWQTPPRSNVHATR